MLTVLFKDEFWYQKHLEYLSMYFFLLYVSSGLVPMATTAVSVIQRGFQVRVSDAEEEENTGTINK